MAESTIPTELQAFIEEALAALATKADLEGLATKADLVGLATKEDLAGVAKNVDITALTRLVRQSITDTAMLRGEVRMTTATLQQLVGTVGGFANLLQALVDQQGRLDDRVRTVENRVDTLEDQQPH
jgi:hypothetical protein